MKYQDLGRGLVKRTEKRVLGLFIDGTSLDRASRRINKRVDMQALVKGVISGAEPVVARYYTLIPFEDDSRQRSFLDAISRAGLQVIVKRLPPKGITRQVTIDVEMAADITAFALGHSNFGSLSEYLPDGEPSRDDEYETREGDRRSEESQGAVRRIVTLVCPSRDLAYSISLANELGAETITADFGEFGGGDVMKSAAKWIDLSGSESIWRED